MLAQGSAALAICLLFLTDLRISNLRNISVGDLRRFIKGKDLVVSLIKSKSKNLTVYPYNKSYGYYLKPLKADFDLFLKKRADFMKPAWTIARETLTRRINKILKKASIKLQRNIKSHSFRIGIATTATERHTIHKAQQIMGHSAISTTQKYARGTLNRREKAKILADITAPPAWGKTVEPPKWVYKYNIKGVFQNKNNLLTLKLNANKKTKKINEQLKEKRDQIKSKFKQINNKKKLQITKKK